MTNRRTLSVRDSVGTRVQAACHCPAVVAVRWHPRHATAVGHSLSRIGAKTTSWWLECTSPTSLSKPLHVVRGGFAALVSWPQRVHLEPPAGQCCQLWFACSSSGCCPSCSAASCGVACSGAAVASCCWLPGSCGASACHPLPWPLLVHRTLEAGRGWGGLVQAGGVDGAAVSGYNPEPAGSGSSLAC